VLAAVAAAAPRAELNQPPNRPMHISPPPPQWVPVWCRCMFALVALSLLAGCASQGDFGEVRPALVRDDIHDWLGRPTSTFEFTDDERQLRDLAYPLIEPPYDRQQWYSVAGEYGLTGSDRRTDRTEYTTRLLSSRFRSPSARYSQLTDDVRNDVTRLPEFFETAARVLDIDQKRRKSLAFISDLSHIERDNALRRIHENELLVSKVHEKLAQRVTAYRFALERLVVMTPSPQAVDVERSLNQMQTQILRYRNRAAPTWTREQSLAAAR
jgi:hypothetical protein